MTVVRDIDHGYAQMIRTVFGFRKRRISAGVLEADGAKPKQVRPGAHHLRSYGTGELAAIFGIELEEAPERPFTDQALTVIEVACFNEFGTDRIPARSFIRAWFDEEESVLKERLRRLMVAVIRGDLTRDQALEQLAQYAVGAIQKRIADGISPANAPSTIAQKGSSTPLVDTGQLRSSIHYRIEEDA